MQLCLNDRRQYALANGSVGVQDAGRDFEGIYTHVHTYTCTCVHYMQFVFVFALRDSYPWCCLFPFLVLPLPHSISPTFYLSPLWVTATLSPYNIQCTCMYRHMYSTCTCTCLYTTCVSLSSLSLSLCHSGLLLDVHVLGLFH